MSFHPKEHFPSTRESTYDFVDLEELTNDGKFLTAFAVLIGEDGRPVRVAVSYLRGDDGLDVVATPEVPGEACRWVLDFGVEILADAKEILSLQRDYLRARDVMGPMVGFWLPDQHILAQPWFADGKGGFV